MEREYFLTMHAVAGAKILKDFSVHTIFEGIIFHCRFFKPHNDVVVVTQGIAVVLFD